MAATQTTRLQIYRWSAGSDAYNRAQMDASHAALETRVGVFLSGTLGARPAAGASNDRGFYLATDTGVLYYSNGSSWTALNQFATPSGTATPGDSASAGAAGTIVRSDHKHAMLPWGTTGQLAQVGTTAAQGSTDAYARVDHVHVLASGAVTAGKIAAGGVSATNQIADGIITASKFAPGAIDEGAISPDQRIPVGSMMPYGGATAPTGWLLCDGSSYATGDYGALFGVIAYRYGGSGGTFNVPDLRDCVPRGLASTGGSPARVLHAQSESVQLLEANLPAHNHGSGTYATASNGSHNHTFSDTSSSNGDHDHQLAGNTAGTDGGQLQLVADKSFYPSGANLYGLHPTNDTGRGKTFNNGAHTHSVSGTTSSNGNHTHTISGTSGSTGSGTAFDIKNNHVTVNFIIKT